MRPVNILLDTIVLESGMSARILCHRPLDVWRGMGLDTFRLIRLICKRLQAALSGL